MKRFIIYIGIALLVWQCKKDNTEDPITPKSTVEFSIYHNTNNNAIEFDSIQYNIPSNYEISLTRLEYYISAIKFKDAAGNILYTDNSAHYINGRNTNSFTVHEMPTGDYSKIALTLGISPNLNVYGEIPNTPENIGMIWPENMGGGYHFLKLEGHFRKPNTTNSAGYAIHLGETGYEVEIEKELLLSVKQGVENKISIEVDPLQWLSNPNNYDFDVDGNYTMGIANLMQKIYENGSSTVTRISEL